MTQRYRNRHVQRPAVAKAKGKRALLVAWAMTACSGAAAPPPAVQTTTVPPPPSSVAAPTAVPAPCGSYVAAAKGSYESLVFESGARVVVRGMGLEFEKAYVLDGDLIRIDGGLFVRQVDATTLALEEHSGPGERFVRSNDPATPCVSKLEDLALTCFDRAEDLRRTSRVPEAQLEFGKCCETGNLRGCAAYGAMLLLRNGDRKGARAPLLRACEGGRGEACATIAQVAEEEGSPTEQRRYLSLACNLKHADSCAALNHMQ